MPRTARSRKAAAGPPGLLPPGEPLPAPARVALALVFVLLALLCCRQVSSLDVGFHLRAGERLLAGGGWPRNDPFTFTLEDRPYIDTSWGYQVVLAAARRLGDAPGVVALHGLLVLGTFAVLYRTARLAPVDPASLVAVTLAGAAASEMRYEARPELASWLLLAAVLHLLHRHAEGRRSPLWLLPLLHLLWANVHGLFVLGWIAILCFAVGGSLARRRPEWALAGWGFLSVAATLVNPYGWRGMTFPFTLATRLEEENAFGQSIGEFTSPFALGLSKQLPFAPQAPLWAFRLLAVASVFALAGALRSRRWGAALLLLPFGLLAVKMVRNVPLFVIACLPWTAWSLSVRGLLGRSAARAAVGRRLAAGALAAAGLIAVVLAARVVTDAYYIASRRVDRFGWGWNRLSLPVDAAEFVARTGLRGPMLNHLNFGGYLMWALREPVFIDGRLEVVGEEFYGRYRAILESAEAMERAVDRWGIRFAIFPYATNPRLLGRLSGDASWRLAYADPLAAIFVRADGPAASVPEVPPPPPAPPLDALPGLGGPPRPGRAARWAEGLVARQRFPSEGHYLGLFHLYRGELPAAGAHMAAAIDRSGGRYYEIYNNLGAVLHRQGRAAEAAGCYRVVLAERPDDPIARQRAAARGPSRAP
jgi:hypothetical protein